MYALNLIHANLIRIYKIVDTKDYGAIIMERFKYGKSLQFILSHLKGKFNIFHRFKILIDVAAGLQFCHSADLVHLDLKPDNIMMVMNNDNEYICKIFDFGCSSKCSRRNENKNHFIKNSDDEDEQKSFGSSSNYVVSLIYINIFS